jgi:hypothetical protein
MLVGSPLSQAHFSNQEVVCWVPSTSFSKNFWKIMGLYRHKNVELAIYIVVIVRCHPNLVAGNQTGLARHAIMIPYIGSHVINKLSL